jgi:hypothetical protein
MASSSPLPEACPCCGGKIHNPNDLIAYKIFRPGPEIPKADLLKGVCDICGETRAKKRKPIAARIIYTKLTTGEFLREDFRCTDCYKDFAERHGHNK